MNPITVLIAGGAGVIVAIVTYRALRDQGPFGQLALPIALAGAGLAAIGILNLGQDLLFLCIPWMALAVVLPLCMFFGWVFKGRNPRGYNPNNPNNAGNPKPCKDKCNNNTSYKQKPTGAPLGSLLAPHTPHDRGVNHE